MQKEGAQFSEIRYCHVKPNGFVAVTYEKVLLGLRTDNDTFCVIELDCILFKALARDVNFM